MNAPLVWPLPDLAATRHLAQSLAQAIRPPVTLALNGTLGAGKTQLVRDLVAALDGEASAVTSPTYVLQQDYAAKFPIHHFDFYRLESAAQVWDLGIDELFEQPALVLIEWANKFPECLPDDYLDITISYINHTERSAAVSAQGAWANEQLQRLMLLSK
jgi:tRNA threonylcarbamoyl adenosine modification protein YjeE